MDKKDLSAEPHIQQMGERKKQRRPEPGIEDVRRLKMDNFILVILVSILFGLVISLFISLDKVVDDVNFLSEHFIALLDVIKDTLV